MIDLPTILAIAIAAGCAVASARRVAIAARTPSFDPDVILAALRDRAGPEAWGAWAAIADEIARDAGESSWEGAWIDAMRARPGESIESRAARVNAELAEIDHDAQRWAAVPRVCARVASTSGFLLASIAMCRALTDDEAGDPSQAAGRAIATALAAITIGIAGAVFCVASAKRARVAIARRLASLDRLVDRVDAIITFDPAVATRSKHAERGREGDRELAGSATVEAADGGAPATLPAASRSVYPP